MTTQEERAAALATVLDTLVGLGGRAPGSPLRADDWNALVGTLASVARLSGAGDDGTPGASAGEPGELPPGSVSMEELAPEVQTLLRSGPFADPDKVGERFALDRRLVAATDRIAALESRLEALLSALRRAETDLSRQGSDLRLVDQRVAGTTGLRTEVGQLRTLLGSVRTDVTDVLELRRDLDGVDLGELRANVTDLAGFRDAWRDEQGRPLTFAGLSRRLAEVSDRAVTDEELGSILDARLDNFVVDPGPIRTAVTNDLRAELATATTELDRSTSATLTQALAELRAGLTAEVTRTVGARMTDVGDRLADIAGRAADERLALARDEIRTETARLVEDRFAGLPPRVAPADLDELETRLVARVDEARAAAITPDAAEVLVGRASTDLGHRIDEVSAQVEANRRGQAELGSTLRRERGDAAAVEARRLEGLLDTRVRQEAVERAGAVAAAEQRVTADLGTRLEQTAQTLRAERDAAVATAVEARTGSIRGELEARIRVVAQDAVAAVESDVSDLRGRLGRIDARVTDLDGRLVVGGGVVIGRGGTIGGIGGVGGTGGIDLGGTVVERPVIPGDPAPPGEPDR